MTGFEAIAHHNGWMMALFGALIVFSGLAVLSFVISQLPKVFSLFEEKSREQIPPPKIEESPQESTTPDDGAVGLTSTDPAVMARQIQSLASTLEEPFQLSELYRLCREKDLPHPHMSLTLLRQQGILQSQGEGSFTWKSDATTSQEG